MNDEGTKDNREIRFLVCASACHCAVLFGGECCHIRTLAFTRRPFGRRAYRSAHIDQQWRHALQKVLVAQDSLRFNPQAKLLLTDLLLNI